MVTRSDQASLLDGQRRVIDQGGLDGRPDLGAELQRRFELGQTGRSPGREPGLHLRQQGQRPGEGRQVTGRGTGGGHPRGQPLQVVAFTQQLAEVAAEAGITHQLFNGCGPLGDQLDRRQGRGQVIGKQASAHRGDRAIDDLRAASLHACPRAGCVSAPGCGAVISSRPRVSALRYGVRRMICPSDDFWVSFR